MTAVYIFAAAVGVPLVAWFLFAGGDDGAADGLDAQDGVGGLMLRLLPLSTVAIAVAAFGAGGLVLGAVGTSPAGTFLGALGVAVLAGTLNSAVFSYVRRSDSGATTSDADLAGVVGRVVHPVAAGQRGRIAVSVGDQRRYLSALALPDEPSAAPLSVGDPVLVVEVRGGVAHVTRLDPQLSDDVHDPGASNP